MASDSRWARRGEGAVGAAADLVVGLGRGFASIGSRLKRSQYKTFTEGLCAVAGDVASRNGRLKPEEIEAFRRFLISNRSIPAIKPFDTEELTERFKDYAVKAFLCDDATFARIIDETKTNAEGKKDLAELILIGALAVAYADGDCDEGELSAIRGYAKELSVDLDHLIAQYAQADPEALDSPSPAPSLPEGTIEETKADPRPIGPGEKVDIRGSRAILRLRWTPERLPGGDVDVSAFVLKADGRVASDADFVFYNQPQARDGAVTLETASGGASLSLDLSRLSAEARVALAVTLPEGGALPQLSTMMLELEGQARFNPELAGRTEVALILGEVYQRSGSWRLKAVGEGFSGGLGQLATHFGVDIA